MNCFVCQSTTNTTNFARISADIRWQPAVDKFDPRYVGSEKGGSMDTFLDTMTVSGAWKVEGQTKAVEATLSGKAVREETSANEEVETKVDIIELRKRWGFPVDASAAQGKFALK